MVLHHSTPMSASSGFGFVGLFVGTCGARVRRGRSLSPDYRKRIATFGRDIASRPVCLWRFRFGSQGYTCPQCACLAVQVALHVCIVYVSVEAVAGSVSSSCPICPSCWSLSVDSFSLRLHVARRCSFGGATRVGPVSGRQLHSCIMDVSVAVATLVLHRVVCMVLSRVGHRNVCMGLYDS